MTQLVTKEEAMNFLRYDEEPPELNLLINAASAAVLNYLGDDASFLEDESDGSDGEDSIVVPDEVKAACLLWMGQMDQNREGAKIDQYDPRSGYGYPPATVVALLSGLRQPRMS
jgi:hypothetical protein